MSLKIGILYATVDGQTRKISNYISDIFIQQNNTVQLFTIDDFKDNILDFDVFIIGSSIRYGKHHPKLNEFIDKYISELNQVKTAFFSVNLVARKEDKNRYNTNPYLIKFLESITWKPTLTDVFGGKLDYDAYPFFDKLMIKLIMKITKGPTKTEKPIEYTDWNRVEEFAVKVGGL